MGAAIRHAIINGDSPFVSHAIGPLGLHDDDKEERELGIAAGLVWMKQSDALVMYVDLGISEGMAREKAEAEKLGIPIEMRSLGLAWEQI
jgi:hypothetical protein